MINRPTELSACVIWLDGSNSTYFKSLSTGSGDVTNGSAVGYWQNLGSLSSVGHFTNIGGDSTTRPTYISSLSCLRFDGSNDYLTLSATQTYTAQTTFVVTAPRAFQDGDRICTQAANGVNDAANYIQFYQSGAAGNLGSFTPNNVRSITSHRALSTFDTFTSWHSGGGIINFRNGESATAFAHTLGTFIATRHRVGTGISTTGGPETAYYNGDISEVIVYSRALTNAEREDVEYYLSRKWSVLNSIPRQVYALKSGNWSDSTLWSVSADPVPWNVPIATDNVYTNTFTITADSSTKVDTIRNSINAPNILSGGSFVLANGVSLSAGFTAPSTNTTLMSSFVTTESSVIGRIVPGVSPTSVMFSHNGSGTVTLNAPEFFFASSGNFANILINNGSGKVVLIGNVITGSSSGVAYQFINNSNGSIDIIGNVLHRVGFGLGYMINLGTGTISVTGDVVGGFVGNLGQGQAIYVGNNLLRVLGNVYGGNCPAIYVPAGRVEVIGNVFGGGYYPGGGNGIPGINAESTGTISVTGNCIAGFTTSAITHTSTTGTRVSAYGNIINAPNGRQAIYAPRYQVFPSSSPTYTRHAVNGYDSFVDYWTSNSTFSYPASSDVALGTIYSNSTLSGSMVLPSPSSVALGALVGNTAGTASITLNNFWSAPTTSLTTSNSIGSRLRNISTTQSLTAIIDSLT